MSKVVSNSFIAWLMGLTTIMRYFVIAVIFHAALLFALGMVKFVSVLPQVIAKFEDVPLPPAEEAVDDSMLPYREFAYNGPTVKEAQGGGAGGKGPGGVPTAGGGTPENYNASILASSSGAEQQSMVGEVIGVASGGESFTRALGGGSGPTGLGFGDTKFGTGGVKGPGGPLGLRMGPKIARGNNEATERAVLAGLRWLKEKQQPDGSWQLSASIPGATGLAVLCFLGHGELPDTSKEFGLTVHKGLTYLATTLPSDGIAGGNMYAQGIVTLALSEGFAMTQSPQLRDPAERALKVILSAQNVAKNPANAGGWRYSPTSTDSDVSGTGWQIMAMKSAKAAGLEVPTEAFEKASDYLWRMYSGSGFGYADANPTLAMTGVGTLCQQFMGHGSDPRIQKALDYIHQQKVEWDKSQGWVIYAWYYFTQAMFQSGGSNWEYWNNQIRDTLVKNQTMDGPDVGHWDTPKQAGDIKEPVYSTTMCILMLEVYYRYMPIMQMLEGGAPVPKATTPSRPPLATTQPAAPSK